MLGRGGILLCPRGFPAVTVRLKLRDGAAKSPCTCGLDSEIYNKRVIVNSRIPFNKYKGITILLELETAQTTLDNEFSKWHIDLQKIRTTLCPEGRVLLIKSKQKIDHIFAEILSVENQIRLPYYWLKILENRLRLLQ